MLSPLTGDVGSEYHAPTDDKECSVGDDVVTKDVNDVGIDDEEDSTVRILLTLNKVWDPQVDLMINIL